MEGHCSLHCLQMCWVCMGDAGGPGVSDGDDFDMGQQKALR